MTEMTAPTATPEVVRFGPYEVEVRSGELRKFGTRIKLGEQPLRILMLLIERPGELVSREELRSQLWSDDTFVDFDHGLNSAVQRLRESLSDTAEKAKWIETVPRRGYRFVGTVEWTKANGSAPVANAVEQLPAILQPQQAPVPAVRRMLEWRAVSLAVALVLMAVVAIVLVRRPGNVKPATSIRSLAVLPLENLTGDPSQDYFADGMTDELITALAKIHSLRVISRTSVMQYKGIRRPVRDIAHELGVDGILEGSISHAGNRVHLRVQLIHAASDTHVWAESYDRELDEAFALPVVVSETIARQVDVAVLAPASQHYVNPEARDAYLRGRFFWFSADDGSSLQYFEKAIQLQPDYAAAWSGLADYYGGRAVAGVVPPQEFRENWESDARKAIALDDSMADGHNSLAAWYFFGAWDWKRAEAESLRAIALNPNYAEAYHVYSYILTATNRPREAVEAQKRGMEVDPFARPWALGYTYYHLHQFDAAVNELRLREHADPRSVATHDILAQVYQAVGAEEAAVQEWEQLYLLQDDKESATALRKAFERGGYKAVTKWRREHETEGTRGRYFSPFWLALRTAEARRKEETLKLLEDAYREHSPRLVFLQSEPVFDFLRSEPRYQAIVRKVGLAAGPVE